MVKNQDFNPHYFHKPSLHFYLRIPFVKAGIVWGKSRGLLTNTNEIRTRDPHGLAGYAFTASHPFIVVWTRLPSLLLTGLLVFLTVLVTAKLGADLSAQIAAGLLVFLSPEVVKNSTVIGVDTLMATTTVLAVLLSISLLETHTRLRVLCVGLACGLAVSSKYNAAPVVAVPFFTLLLSKQFTVSNVFILAFSSALGFFAASPYILIELTTFVTQLLFEVNHYRGGHVGSEAEPGFAQALFYGDWLIHDGVGLLAAICGFLGAFIIFFRNRCLALSFLCFPILYAALMISQRTHFTRNMVVMVPFVAILSSFCIDALRSKIAKSVLFAAVMVQPLVFSFEYVESELDHPESRRELENVIRAESSRGADVATAGWLLMPINLFALPGVDAFDQATTTPKDLFLKGFDTVIVSEDQRLPDNPEVNVLRFDRKVLDAQTAPYVSMDTQMPEGYTWLTTRISRLKTGCSSYPCNIALECVSPWPDQTIQVGSASEVKVFPQPGAWITLSWTLSKPDFAGSYDAFVYVDKVRSPASHQMSEDKRRLGVAIKRMWVEN